MKEVIDDIRTFQGGYGYLSNAHRCAIRIGPYCYPTAWHAFYALGVLDKPDHDAICLKPRWKGARRISRVMSHQPFYLDTRIALMEKIIRAKFSNARLAEQLTLTVGLTITYTGFDADAFWGVTPKGGHNNLGKILMSVRAEISGADARKNKHIQESHPPMYA